MLAIVKYDTNSNTRGYERAVRDTCKNVIPDQCNAFNPFKREMVSPLN